MNPSAAAAPRTLVHASIGEEFHPQSAEDLAAYVAENAAGPRRALYPAGGRTALDYGYPPSRPGVLVSTARLASLVEYPARDMTVTVGAGMRVRDLAGTLRQEGQQLPVDVPSPEQATVGGIVATNASGPRRFGYGTLRDYVIGISAVDGTGRLFSAGGRVVKNVAGYDLCKLLVGSLGTLGFVTQVTFKLRPIPASQAILCAAFDNLTEIDAALARLLTSDSRPVSLDVINAVAAAQLGGVLPPLATERPILAVGVEGAPADVAWQLGRLKDELSPYRLRNCEVVSEESAEALRVALTGRIADPQAAVIFKANVSPSRVTEFIDEASRLGASVTAHAGNGIVIGRLWEDVAAAAAERLESLRRLARTGRGSLVVVRCPGDWKSGLRVFGDPEASWPLMKRVKDGLDPHGVLSPGRFFDGTPANL